jgi:rhamnosyl/mannosyltransferase
MRRSFAAGTAGCSAASRAPAVAINTVSAFSRARLADRLGVPGKRINVIHNGGDHLLHVQASPGYLASVGLAGRRFVLAVGSENVTKNFGAVIEAMAELGRRQGVAGDRRRPTRAVFAPAAGKTEASDRVIRLGPVGDAELKALYGARSRSCFASSYEGFGLPPLEAMSCGCPVLASSATAVPEVCGDAACMSTRTRRPTSPGGSARSWPTTACVPTWSCAARPGCASSPGRRPRRGCRRSSRRRPEAGQPRLEGSPSLQVLPARAGRDGGGGLRAGRGAGPSRRRPGRALRRRERRTVVETRPAGYRVTRAGSWGSLLATSVAPALLGRLRELQQGRDLIHVHMPDPLAALALWHQPTSAKVVVHWHSDVVRQRIARRLYEPLQHWLLSRADAIVATSEPYAASSPWLKRWSAKTTVVPIGIGDNAGRRDAAAAESIRRRFGNRRIVFSLGRMSQYKGFDVLIDAAARLPEHCVVVVGGDGELLERHRREVARRGLADRIVFVGRISDQELPAYYQAAHVFCLASTLRSEAYGVAIVEAMAMSTPSWPPTSPAPACPGSTSRASPGRTCPRETARRWPRR